MHVPIDPNSLPQDPNSLQKIVLNLAEQLDRAFAEQHKYENLLRELLEAQRNRKSEQLLKEQLALFEAAWQAQNPEDGYDAEEDDDDFGSGGQARHKGDLPNRKPSTRQPLARHLNRERIVHDLAESEKHCACCGKDLRLIEEEVSEHYDYVPASLRMIQDVCLKYACDCTVKTAGKPPRPIEKSTAGASLLAQVIVAKFADHQPLHRQEKMFERCILQARAGIDRGRVLDACAKVCVQGTGIGRAADAAGAAPDRTIIRSGGSRQSAFVVGRATPRIAAACVSAVAGQTAAVFAGTAAESVAEEPVGRARTLRFNLNM